MGNKVDEIHDIIYFLDNDLKDVTHILKRPNVYEVMLNAFQDYRGNFEGHIWYEESGVGQKRSFSTIKKAFNKDSEQYPYPKLKDNVIIKVLKNGDGAILNYRVITDLSKLLSYITGVLIYTFGVDNEKLTFLEQLEDPKLIDLSNYINSDQFNTDKKTINEILVIINKKLADIDISFELKLVEISNSEVNFPEPKYLISKKFHKVESTKVEQIIGLLASVNDLFAHNKSPVVECQIPVLMHRFTGILPPVSKFPIFTIRKHSSRIITLDEYVAQGVMPNSVADILREWVKRRMNILIAGGTGSGKTTLLNSLLKEVSRITPNDRVCVIEDTPEIQCKVDNSFSIAKTNEVDLPALLRTSLRMRPDRIVVGEVRGKEAYTLLKAWMSGHPGGLGSIHADSAKEAIARFEQCVRESSEVEKLPKEPIAGAINGIISIQRVTLIKEVNGIKENVIKRKVTAVRSITGYDRKYDIYTDLWLYKDPETFMQTLDYDASDDDVLADYANLEK